MKRILAAFLVFILFCSLMSGCAKKGDVSVLDGKKIIFVGNSFTYFGKTVLEKKQSVLTQEKRSNDHGFFYQLCKENGMDVEVTNWTFGGHTLEHMFGGNCSADRGCDGVDHLSYLTDRHFDYVVIQEGSGEPDSLDWVEKVMAIFREANPDVKVIYLEHSNAHFKNFARLSQLKDLEKKGITIVDWGNLVVDVANGAIAVPGAAEEYNKNTFIISKSEKDGYHPNMLSGYITTLMTFCAITGAKAEGQPYAFCDDRDINKAFHLLTFDANYYTYSSSNFQEVFASKSDMRGIQQLIDQYLKEKPYLEFE